MTELVTFKLLERMNEQLALQNAMLAELIEMMTDEPEEKSIRCSHCGDAYDEDECIFCGPGIFSMVREKESGVSEADIRAAAHTFIRLAMLGEDA